MEKQLFSNQLIEVRFLVGALTEGLKMKNCAREGCTNSFDSAKDIRKRFCSHSCAAKVTNVERSSPKVCINCGVQLSNRKQSACSHTCHWEYRRKSIIKSWREGQWGQRSKYLSSIIRNHLIEESDFKCSSCGWDRLHPDGSSPLQIDHINGDGYDHSPDNLRVLCPNCHSLTVNFGGRNKGSGRAYRREQRARLNSS